jgi:glucoamylase
MPLAWAHAEFVKLLMSRQINRPFDRPRAMWQRYRARRPVAAHAFWWPHAPIGAMRAGARLAVALPFPSVVRWGRDGWQQIDNAASTDSNLGFHVAVLDTAALPPGSQVDFTWRHQDNGEWAGRDIAVMVRGPEAGGPVGAA